MKYLVICVVLICSFCSCLYFKDNKIHWTQENVKNVLVLDTTSMAYKPSKGIHIYKTVKGHRCPLIGETFGLSPIENLKSIVVKEKMTKGLPISYFAQVELVTMILQSNQLHYIFTKTESFAIVLY